LIPRSCRPPREPQALWICYENARLPQSICQSVSRICKNSELVNRHRRSLGNPPVPPSCSMKIPPPIGALFYLEFFCSQLSRCWRRAIRENSASKSPIPTASRSKPRLSWPATRRSSTILSRPTTRHAHRLTFLRRYGCESSMWLLHFAASSKSFALPTNT